MVATVVSLTSASSTVHYFRREGHGLGPNLPANDPGSGSGAGNEAFENIAAAWDRHVEQKLSRGRGMSA